MILTAINNRGVFNLTIADMSTITPQQIAYSLSHINRFNGNAGQYSVAQHCVLVAQYLPPELKLAGLLHDAHESVIGDISTPVKKLIGAKRLDEVDAALLDSLDATYNVDTRHELVAKADAQVLVDEAFSFDLLIGGTCESKQLITRWTPETAEKAWLNAFYAFTGGIYEL